MRYIKTYEKWGGKYDIGDYILLKNIFFKSGYNCKIIHSDDKGDFYRILDENGEMKFANDDMIIRKLTPEEIEEYETKMKVIKYNL